MIGTIDNHFLDHFCIHSSKLEIDSINSCPLFVNLYSTRGGTFANVCRSSIPSETSSDNLVDNVLLLIPSSDFELFMSYWFCCTTQWK